MDLSFGEGLGGDDLFLGLDDGNVVGEGLLGTHLAIGIPGQHNLDLDAQDSLPQEDVSANKKDL